jgi:hypothetical protein
MLPLKGVEVSSRFLKEKGREKESADTLWLYTIRKEKWRNVAEAEL